MISLITSVAGNAHLLLADEHRQMNYPSCYTRMIHRSKRTGLTQITLLLHYTGESNISLLRRYRMDAGYTFKQPRREL